MLATGYTGILTAGADLLNGTVGNDTFNATASTAGAGTSATYTVADAIHGGEGSDTLNLTIDTLAANSVPGATVTGIEVVNVRNVSGAAQTIAGTNFVGADLFMSERSTNQVDFTSIKSADVTLKGNGTTAFAATNIAVSATVGNAVVAAADSITDAFTLNLSNGVVGGAAITVNDTNADWTVANINSSGIANTVGAINLSGLAATAATHTVKDLNINADIALVTTGITGFDATVGVTNTIKVKGAAAATSTSTGVSIGTLAAAVDVVDASGLTAGGLTATLSAATQIVTGGAGNDRITTGGVVLTTGSVDAGAGTADRLTVTASADLTLATGSKYKNFEVLQVEDAVSANLDHIAGITVNAVGISPFFPE